MTCYPHYELEQPSGTWIRNSIEYSSIANSTVAVLLTMLAAVDKTNKNRPE